MTPTASRTLSSVLSASLEPCLPPSTRKDWIPVIGSEKINVNVFFTKAMAYPFPFPPEPSQALVLSSTPELWGFNNQFETLPKALRTQALTALTSNFGLVGLVRWVWLGWFG